jgi:hypothetical protein
MTTTVGEFDVVMQHLGAALEELHVPKTGQDELVELLRPMRDDIVEVESPETGTPLPDSYQAALLWRDPPDLLIGAEFVADLKTKTGKRVRAMTGARAIRILSSSGLTSDGPRPATPHWGGARGWPGSRAV